jgi:hypothetical protein
MEDDDPVDPVDWDRGQPLAEPLDRDEVGGGERHRGRDGGRDRRRIVVDRAELGALDGARPRRIVHRIVDGERVAICEAELEDGEDHHQEDRAHDRELDHRRTPVGVETPAAIARVMEPGHAGTVNVEVGYGPGTAGTELIEMTRMPTVVLATGMSAKARAHVPAASVRQLIEYDCEPIVTTPRTSASATGVLPWSTTVNGQEMVHVPATVFRVSVAVPGEKLP